MAENGAPIGDQADFVSAFMGLPKILQEAALLVVLAARDTPQDQAEWLAAVFDTMGKSEIAEESQHYANMCGNVFHALTIARFAGQV